MRPKRNPEVVWRLEKGMHEMAWDRARKGEEYENLGVLTLMTRGSIHQLNLVGAEIWTRITGVNSVEKIVDEIGALFDVAPGEIEADVVAFLRESERNGWVTMGGAAGPDPRWTPR